MNSNPQSKTRMLRLNINMPLFVTALLLTRLPPVKAYSAYHYLSQSQSVPATEAKELYGLLEDVNRSEELKNIEGSVIVPFLRDIVLPILQWIHDWSTSQSGVNDDFWMAAFRKPSPRPFTDVWRPARQQHGRRQPAGRQGATYATPLYAAPSYAAPTYMAPAYTAPAYTTPVFTAPAYSTPHGQALSSSWIPDFLEYFSRDPLKSAVKYAFGAMSESAASYVQMYLRFLTEQ